MLSKSVKTSKFARVRQARRKRRNRINAREEKKNAFWISPRLAISGPIDEKEEEERSGYRDRQIHKGKKVYFAEAPW